MNKELKNGFTLLEVLVVVTIIGILAALAWSGFGDLIRMNKAKETAREMTTFAQRALSESYMRKLPVHIEIRNDSMVADTGDGDNRNKMIGIKLSSGYSISTAAGPDGCAGYNPGTTALVRVGYSSIDTPGCFIACHSNSFCASSVKTATVGALKPYIKKRNSAAWEAL